MYEATVGAGLPVISTKNLLDTGDRVVSIEGILTIVIMAALFVSVHTWVPHCKHIRHPANFNSDAPCPPSPTTPINAGKHWMYEATVGAGLPVISTLKHLFDSGDRVVSIEGTLTLSSRHILDVDHVCPPPATTLVRLATSKPTPLTPIPSPPAGKHWMYEATVGAGLPVISTLKNLLDTGDRVVSIEGILSGTLSYLFNTYR
jgi:hypothetical protein